MGLTDIAYSFFDNPSILLWLIPIVLVLFLVISINFNKRV